MTPGTRPSGGDADGSFATESHHLLRCRQPPCEKAQQWRRALGRLAMMREARLLPDVIAYSTAVRACEEV